MAQRITAHKAKTGETYVFRFNADHLNVLRTLDRTPGLSDADLTFRLRRHMIAPRRCELRDAGMVERHGVKGQSLTWRLTALGRRVLAEGVQAVAA